MRVEVLIRSRLPRPATSTGQLRHLPVQLSLFPPSPSHELWKDPGIAGVACQKPPGLPGQTIQPLQAAFSHPHRRPLLFPSQKIDRAACTNGHLRCQAISVRVHPKLLLRRSQTDDENIRLHAGNLIADGGVGGIVPLKTDRRTRNTHHFDWWPCVLDPLGSTLTNPRLSAK